MARKFTVLFIGILIGIAIQKLVINLTSIEVAVIIAVFVLSVIFGYLLRGKNVVLFSELIIDDEEYHG